MWGCTHGNSQNLVKRLSLISHILVRSPGNQAQASDQAQSDHAGLSPDSMTQ